MVARATALLIVLLCCLSASSLVIGQFFTPFSADVIPGLHGVCIDAYGEAIIAVGANNLFSVNTSAAFFGAVSQFALGLELSNGHECLYAGDQQLYVTDQSANIVWVVNNGGVISQLQPNGIAYASPSGIAAPNSETLLISNLNYYTEGDGTGYVVSIDLSSGVSTEYGSMMNGMGLPRSLAFDAKTGVLFVSDGNLGIVAIPAGGGTGTIFASTLIYGIAITSDGILWGSNKLLTENNLLAYSSVDDATGVLVYAETMTPPPFGLALYQDGTLLEAGFNSGPDANPSYIFSTPTNSSSCSFPYPLGGHLGTCTSIYSSRQPCFMVCAGGAAQPDTGSYCDGGNAVVQFCPGCDAPTSEFLASIHASGYSTGLAFPVDPGTTIRVFVDTGYSFPTTSYLGTVKESITCLSNNVWRGHSASIDCLLPTTFPAGIVSGVNQPCQAGHYLPQGEYCEVGVAQHYELAFGSEQIWCNSTDDGTPVLTPFPSTTQNCVNYSPLFGSSSGWSNCSRGGEYHFGSTCFVECEAGYAASATFPSHIFNPPTGLDECIAGGVWQYEERCVQCPVNTYSAQPGQVWPCTPCPLGSFTSVQYSHGQILNSKHFCAYRINLPSMTGVCGHELIPTLTIANGGAPNATVLFEISTSPTQSCTTQIDADGFASCSLGVIHQGANYDLRAVLTAHDGTAPDIYTDELVRIFTRQLNNRPQYLGPFSIHTSLDDDVDLHLSAVVSTGGYDVGTAGEFSYQVRSSSGSIISSCLAQSFMLEPDIAMGNCSTILPAGQIAREVQVTFLFHDGCAYFQGSWYYYVSEYLACTNVTQWLPSHAYYVDATFDNGIVPGGVSFDIACTDPYVLSGDSTWTCRQDGLLVGPDGYSDPASVCNAPDNNGGGGSGGGGTSVGSTPLPCFINAPSVGTLAVGCEYGWLSRGASCSLSCPWPQTSVGSAWSCDITGQASGGQVCVNLQASIALDPPALASFASTACGWSVSTTVTDSSSDAPVSGVKVVFALLGTGQSLTCSAVSDENGVAQCPLIGVAGQSYTLQASTSDTTLWSATSALTPSVYLFPFAAGLMCC